MTLPKNPRFLRGAVIQKAWSIRAARGQGTVSALFPADADLALAPDFAALATCAASWQYLPVRRRSRGPAAGAHRSSAPKRGKRTVR